MSTLNSEISLSAFPYKTLGFGVCFIFTVKGFTGSSDIVFDSSPFLNNTPCGPLACSTGSGPTNNSGAKAITSFSTEERISKSLRGLTIFITDFTNPVHALSIVSAKGLFLYDSIIPLLSLVLAPLPFNSSLRALRKDS